MAIVDQARFYDTYGLSTGEIGNALADWFRMQGFEWRTFGDPNGRYSLQIRKVGVGRSIFGLNYALSVTFSPQENGKTLVELGGADWTDKIISGAIGVFLVWPLMFTAAYGAWQQSELDDKVWSFLEGYVLNRTGKPANPIIAVPQYAGMPGYNPNTPPQPGTYYPSASYTPSAMSGFPPPPPGGFSTVGESRPGATTDRSWFDTTTMQPIFDQQIGRMASWQSAMADGKIVDEEVREQTEKVEKMRASLEERLSTEQRIKLAEVITAMERVGKAHSSL
jgi:hypothetical protein